MAKGQVSRTSIVFASIYLADTHLDDTPHLDQHRCYDILG